MSDSLFMPLAQRMAGRRELTGWEAVWMPLGEGEAERLTAGMGSGWKPVEVPRQLAAREGRQSIWYRTEFPKPDHAGRVVLRIGGAFLATNVWLNGKLLGSHYGYFAPFGFDLTPYLKPENLLVICCESPLEPEPEKKRHIMGLFNDGDLKPYPASAYSSLPEPYHIEVPLGLWQPVQLEYMGAIAVDWVRLKPTFEAGDGRLEVEARLRNLDGRSMDGEVELVVPAPGRDSVRLRREVHLGGGAEQTVSMRLAFPGARRWQPWRFGESPLYRAEVITHAEGVESSRVDDVFAFRELTWDIGPRRWSFAVNGRPVFLRGACYAPAHRLDELTAETFARDIATAKEAGVDALRVVANVLPLDFYRQADQAGMLVFQDLPLTGTYVYHGRAEEARFFENAARQQQAEMVTMLHNHPSIALWIAHDDPPWLATNFDLGEVHSVRQNHSIDQDLRATFAKLDPSRPAVAASGDVDLHLMQGWAGGGWKDIGLVEPMMVTAFGAQSLPDAESPVWESIGKRWPVADDDPAWRYAGFQPVNWAERGVGLPSAHQSLEQYVEESQVYQAQLVRYAAEHLRTRKFESCWGAFAYHLVDPFPGIGFGLLDGARRPKLALQSLAAAFKPTRVIVEPLQFEPDRPFGFVQDPDVPFAARLVVVNDDPQVGGRGVIRWSVSRERAAGARGLDRMRDVVQKKSYSGVVETEVPTAFEPAVNATTLSLPLAAQGDYRIEAVLTVAGREVDRTDLEFSVSSVQATVHARPEIPRYLAERLADLHSLRPEERGMSFALENRTRPAVLVGVSGLRLDGVLVTGHQLHIETNAGHAPLPKRLDMPLGRRLVVHVVTGVPLGGGAHSLEADVDVPGVASGRLVIENGPVARKEP
ncbi:MAG TPA: glycoside hydrolase family 2 TIM barrel-domain containing protein [Candidatus Dormibacteraeota bacterium]|nr:glycoside hydrolase family 2 TIM barrel-domain containing protein [Candidatus Dormibacteraeota bacterium]